MSCLWPTDSQQRRKNPKVRNNAATHYYGRDGERLDASQVHGVASTRWSNDVFMIQEIFFAYNIFFLNYPFILNWHDLLRF